MSMELSINPEAAKEIVQKAIFDSLSQDARNELVGQAITALTLRPKKDRYAYSGPEPRSPLEEAFDRAVVTIANQVVREYLEDEEIKKAIQAQILAALDKIIQDKGTWLYDQIGLAVGQQVAHVMGGNN
jgi:hypothetical protein